MLSSLLLFCNKIVIKEGVGKKVNKPKMCTYVVIYLTFDPVMQLCLSLSMLAWLLSH